MQKNKSFIFILISIVALSLAQVACKAVMRQFESAPPVVQVVQVTATPQIIYVTATPGPSDAPVDPASQLDAFTDDEIRDGIQQALDLYARAYNEKDPALLTQVVDQQNLPFRRIVRSRFDAFQKSSQAGQFTYEFRVRQIQRREAGFVIAEFSIFSGMRGSWPFRYVDGGWVLSEPTVEQIGEPVRVEGEHFNFTTYPWSDDVNARIIEMLEIARVKNQEVLGVAPSQKAEVQILPIYGLNPFMTSGAIAWYSAGGAEDGGDLISIYAPHSYAYSFYDPYLDWDGTLQQTITHEYAHMVHARSFGRAGRLADWMSEGLAEYVAAADDNIRWACSNAKMGTIIPIIDPGDTAYKHDLMHMQSLQRDAGLAYSYSHALVAFTVQEFGGLDGFWKLARSIDETGSLDKALRASFNTSYADFDVRWMKWLKRQC